MSNLTNHWKQIVDRIPQEQHAGLNPPASDEQLQQLENEIGFAIPVELRELLSINNGMKHLDDGLYPPLLSTKQMAKQQKDMLEIMEPDDEYTPDNLDECCTWVDWLLLFAESDGGGYAIDLNSGAIWDWDHDGWTFEHKADSLSEFLASTAADPDHW
ncbi:MAG: SMI1/KNR4 family protein [Pirellulaceae bacterium]